VWAEDGWTQLGSDLMRLYYCFDISPWDTRKFSLRAAKDLGKALNVLWNTYLFVKTYGSGNAKSNSLKPEDKWIISRANTLTVNVTENLEKFNFHLAGRDLVDFILNDFSRWYIKLVRDRVSPFYSGTDKAAAQKTMNHVLEIITRLLAPMSPFITEKIYTDMFKAESVHMKKWPSPGKRDPEMEKQMEIVKQLIETMNALRQEKKVKLRWPIDKAFVSTKTDIKTFEEAIKLMGNVKEVAFVARVSGKSKEFEGGKVSLGSVLKEEALLREVIRATQALRKKAGLNVQEKISLSLETDAKTQETLKLFEQQLLEGTGSSKLDFKKSRSRGLIEFEGKKIDISF